MCKCRRKITQSIIEESHLEKHDKKENKFNVRNTATAAQSLQFTIHA